MEFKRMKVNLLLSSVLIVSALISSACSNRWREASTGKDSAIIETYLKDVLTDHVTASGNNQDFFADLLQDGEKLVYFSENSEQMGPLNTIIPADFFELSGVDYFQDLKSVKIFFMTRRASENTFAGALLIEYYLNGSDQRKSLLYVNDGLGNEIQAGQISESGDFKLPLTRVSPSGGKVITVYSDDLNEYEDDLGNHIQLDLYDENRRIGKISTLEGF